MAARQCADSRKINCLKQGIQPSKAEWKHQHYFLACKFSCTRQNVTFSSHNHIRLVQEDLDRIETFIFCWSVFKWLSKNNLEPRFVLYIDCHQLAKWNYRIYQVKQHASLYANVLLLNKMLIFKSDSKCIFVNAQLICIFNDIFQVKFL